MKSCPKCRAPIIRDGGCNHMTCGRCHYEFCWMCKRRYNSNHFAPWNIFGCPAGQEGVLACLGDDRFFCINCSCGCGFLGFFKRFVIRFTIIALMLAALPFFLLGLPFYVWCHDCECPDCCSEIECGTCCKEIVSCLCPQFLLNCCNEDLVDWD